LRYPSDRTDAEWHALPKDLPGTLERIHDGAAERETGGR
jgi:hypothetical protein